MPDKFKLTVSNADLKQTVVLGSTRDAGNDMSALNCEDRSRVFACRRTCLSVR